MVSGKRVNRLVKNIKEAHEKVLNDHASISIYVQMIL